MTQEERDQRLSALMMCPQDDPENQYQIGLLFYEEFQDQAEARSWLELAAGQGHQGAIEKLRALDGVQSDAPLPPLGHETLGMWCHFCEDPTRSDTDELCYRVALYLEETYGTEAERDVAHYLTQAADKGHPEASLRLGERLLSTDPAAAVPYLVNAADCHLPRAYSLLAECYSTGLGVAPDPEKAATYWEASAQQGDGEEMLRLAIRFKTGDGVPKLMVKAGIWKERAKRVGVADADEIFAAPASWPSCPLWLQAEAGDVKAWRELGKLYCSGDGAEPDYAKAAECYWKAERLEGRESWLLLGHRLATDAETKGIPALAAACYIKAVEFYTQAAQQGDAEAWEKLAECYRNGWGVDKDEAKAAEHNIQAIKLYTQAAQQGCVGAWMRLGTHYSRGRGAEQDKKAKAVECFAKAAQLGCADGWKRLGHHYSLGWGVEKNKAKAEECFIKAVELYTQAAQLGDAEAWKKLAECYGDGNGVKRDTSKAVECFTEAAQLGCAGAWMRLSAYYSYGWGVNQDKAKAVECFAKAAQLGCADGWKELGVLYSLGEGVEQDKAKAEECFIKAVELYTQAAQQGDANAWEKLAGCYLDGWGVEKDTVKAVECYTMAIRLDAFCGAAWCSLGRCYWWGWGGVQADHVKAAECFENAAKAGHPSAWRWLADCYRYYYYYKDPSRSYRSPPGYIAVHSKDDPRLMEYRAKAEECRQKSHCIWDGTAWIRKD